LKAIEMYEKALFLFKKAEEPVGQGNVHFSKGDVYLYTGKYDKALEMYARALHLYKKGEEPRGQGNTYYRKGQIFFIKGETSNAEIMYDKALPFFEKTYAILNQGNVFMDKGNIYLRKGYNSSALKMYDRSLLLFKKAGSLLDQGNIYHIKGELFNRIGNYSKALEMSDKAMNLFKKINNPMGLANVYVQKGNIYLICDEILKALEMYDKALPLYEKMEFKLGVAQVYRAKGDIFLEYSNYSKALDLYDKAAYFFEKLEEPLGLGCIYKTKGIIFFVTGKSSLSLEFYEKAINIFNKIGEIELESFTMQKKAMVLIWQGEKEEALNLLENAFYKLEKIRTQTAFSEMKGTFMEKVYEQYEETVLFMLENKFYDKAYKYAEAMRARVFLDRMGEGLVPLEKGLKPDLMEKRDNLVARLSALTKQMQETAGKDGKKLEELKRQYRKVESEFEDLLITIRLENPEYAAVKYPQPITVKDVQANVLRPGETLVSYFVSPEKLYVFIVSKDHFKVVPIKINEKEVSGLIKLYNDTLTGDNPNTFSRHCTTLYEKLFKPVEEYVKEGQDIIIVPDGELAKIPFETLATGRDEKGRPTYLLEKYRLRYVQSASLLSLLRKHYRRDSPTQNFIGFGDPVYDYKNFKEGKAERGKPGSARDDEIAGLFRDQYDREKGDWGRLLASGEEVRTIADLFKKKNYRSISNLRKEATEDKAKAADLKDFDYLHFSCHGVLGDMFQGLVLSQIPGASEDGYFTLNEVMNCDYHAKLVVLSACRTGSGKLEKGEGVTGLTRAFMYAGSPAVVASLWKVKDEATKELMIKFYENMIEKGMTKPEALRRAKLAMIERGGDYASPYYWSAFVLYGE